MHVVIFYSTLPIREPAYDDWADRMLARVQDQPGFVRSHSWRDEQGFGVTLSYWESLDAIQAWGRDPEHQQAQGFGREAYQDWRLEIAEVHTLRESS